MFECVSVCKPRILSSFWQHSFGLLRSVLFGITCRHCSNDSGASVATEIEYNIVSVVLFRVAKALKNLSRSAPKRRLGALVCVCGRIFISVVRRQ